MARKPPPQSLAPTGGPNTESHEQINQPTTSVKSPGTPLSFRFSTKPARSTESLQQLQAADQRPYPQASRVPSSPDLDALSLRHQADGPSPHDNTPAASPQKTGFFSNFKSSKSTKNLQQAEAKRPSTRDTMFRGAEHPNPGAVSSSDAQDINKSRDDRSNARRPVATSSRSDSHINRYTEAGATEVTPASGSIQHNTTSKRNKPKGFNLLRRTSSIRYDSEDVSPGEASTSTMNGSEQQHYPEGIRTAPLRAEHDHSFRENVKGSNSRTHSADRNPAGQQSELLRKEQKDTHRNQQSVSMPRSATSISIFGHLKGAGTKAQSFGRNFLGKTSRSGSTNEREVTVDDESYVVKVLNLPLVEQTRATRISKQLETSRDKTEYWMPSFPWRAIDYLNYRGTDAEGLYRVPGSGPQIRRWQRRFDEELDVDLFAQDDLYDINIVGSMLKQWLRELPTEIFPKEAQERVSRTSPNCEEVPQVLIDELSNLPPYNYYLLFAITCHLSLVLEHRATNKMNYQNLTVCFLPCIKLDAYCFRFLTIKWRDCWKGCKTEPYWMEQEAHYLQECDNLKMAQSGSAIDDRNLSSSDSNVPSTLSRNHGEDINRRNYQYEAEDRYDRSSTATTLADNGREYARNTITQESSALGTALTTDDRYLGVNNERGVTQLSPIQPLSPMYLPGSSS